MAPATPQTTVTVERVSNSGNTIADQQQAGKAIHVPAGEVGETYEVRLVDKGGYFRAELVDRTKQVQTSQPSVGPDTSEVGSGLLDPRSDTHSFEIRSSTYRGNPRNSFSSSGQEMRSRLSRQKK